MNAHDLVWYVAYGSNMAPERLRAYLEGAPADATFGAHRGGADPTPPRADRWITLDRAVTYRGRSQRWQGGVAFLAREPTPGTVTPARAWLLGVGQLAELAAQEARLAAAPDPSALAAIPPGGSLVLGGGWYDTIVRLDDIDGRVALSVTTSQELPEAPPTPAYLATITAALEDRPAPGGAPSGPPPR